MEDQGIRTEETSGVLESLITRLGMGLQNMGSSKYQRRGALGKVYLAELVPNLLLVVFGAIVIWSASLTIPQASFPRHVVGIVLGLGCAVAVWYGNYTLVQGKIRLLLILDVILMLMPKLPGLGYNAMGMTGWVQIPLVGLRFQPSELAKPVTILLMASLVSAYNGRIDTLRDYLKLCGVLCIPFLLILTQPDLGTGLIVLVTGASIIVCG